MKKKVAFFTLGCRVNQYETAAMEEKFIKAGFEIVPFDTFSDVYVVNTCAVTAESERKCRQILRRAKQKNPSSVVAAVGCMAQSSADILAGMAEVDLILGTNHKSEIVEAVLHMQDSVVRIDDPLTFTAFEEMAITDFQSRDRAFVKIQDGCDRFCSYCIIPYVRGRVRSRKPQNVLEEVKTLSEKGFREVVLTGIHVASYGRNIDTNLPKIIKEISLIDGIERIRISSIDPTAFDDEFLEVIESTPKLCPHFHVSLQSGSDKILKRMNRRYTKKEYAEKIGALRHIYPDVSITTDIITGFPGETDDDFAETIEYVKSIRLSGIHVFPYSERKGTAAINLDGVNPKSVRENRAKELIRVAETLHKTYATQFLHTIQLVLFEHGKNEKRGFTPHFLRVEVQNASPAPGQILPVRLDKLEGDILYGTVIS